MEYLKCFLCWDLIIRWCSNNKVKLFWWCFFVSFALDPSPLLRGSVLFLTLIQKLNWEKRYFRICLCLEIGSKPQEAILYCQKAISVCKARVQRLMNELKSNPDKDKGLQQTSIVSQVDTYMTDKQVEIVTLTGLSVDLEKKVSKFDLTCIDKHLFIIFWTLLWNLWLAAWRFGAACIKSKINSFWNPRNGSSCQGNRWWKRFIFSAGG